MKVPWYLLYTWYPWYSWFFLKEGSWGKDALRPTGAHPKDGHLNLGSPERRDHKGTLVPLIAPSKIDSFCSMSFHCTKISNQLNCLNNYSNNYSNY